MNKFGKISVVTSALMLPVATLVSSTVGWYLKSQNNHNVDITLGLAYLRPILVSGTIVFIVFLLASVIYAVLAIQKDSDKTYGKIGLLIVSLVLLLTLGAALANYKTDKSIDAFRTNKEQQFYNKPNN